MIFTYNLEELKRHINFLEKEIDMVNTPKELLIELLDKFFPQFPILVADIPIGTKFYRARIHEGGPSYKSLEEFSYVKPEKRKGNTEFGRCNFPAQSIFYCSSSSDTAQMECISKRIDNKVFFISIGEWEVQQPLKIVDIVLHELKEDIHSHLAERRDHVHAMIAGEVDKDQHQCLTLILDFFGKHFSNPSITSHHDYFYSAYLTNRILLEHRNGGELFDGVKFPSIPMIYRGENIALQTSVIDEGKLTLKKAYEIVSVLGKNEKGSDILQTRELNRSLSIANGEINWQTEGRIFSKGRKYSLEDFQKGKILGISAGFDFSDGKL